MKQNLSIVWLKRDLRLQDNEAITNALNSGQHTLLLYTFEDFLLQDKHYSQRHWDFVKQSLEDLSAQLKPYNSKIMVVQNDIQKVIKTINTTFNVTNVFSHKETGILSTFKRDIAFAEFSAKNTIVWSENDNNGVQRGLSNRNTWYQNWDNYMMQAEFLFQPKPNQLLNIN
ncbi:MAG: deoxyribodipyrimidine photo-lyase, partial [Olleya sp.]